MTCRNKSVRESLPEYLFSCLPPESTQAVRGHLETCPECRGDLALMERLVDEPVGEPPTEFWASLAERVTSSTRDRKQRSHRLPLPAWAGGLAAAAAILLLIVGPAKESIRDVRIPEGYYIRMTSPFDPGLEEEILSISKLPAVDLGRSLERDLRWSDDLHGAGGLSDLSRTDVFVGMNNDVLRVFEKLIDDVSRKDELESG